MQTMHSTLDSGTQEARHRRCGLQCRCSTGERGLLKFDRASRCLFGKEVRLQLGLEDVPCCLAHDGPHCAGIHLEVERNGQCLIFASFSYPAQFDVAAPLGVDVKAERGQDSHRLGTGEALKLA